MASGRPVLTVLSRQKICSQISSNVYNKNVKVIDLLRRRTTVMRKKRRMTWLAVGGVLAIGIWLGWKVTSRNAYESAEYKVIVTDGAYEIREYPDLMLARTLSQFESQGEDGSFMRLFGFISGKNEQEQKIAMTVPVFMEQDSSGNDGSMGFVMPEIVVRDGVPTPISGAVRIDERPGGHFAVIRFEGRLSESVVSGKEAKLRQWVEARGLTADFDAETAGYDPPWTPGLFRRNEVLIRIDETHNTNSLL